MYFTLILINLWRWTKMHNSITMLMLTMTNDNDIASKFKVTIRILFAFSRILVLIICIRPNSKNPWFGTTLVKIFNSNSKVVLLYASESWTNTQRTLGKLQVFTNKCQQKEDSKYTLARFNIQQRIMDRNWWQTSAAAADKKMKLVPDRRHILRISENSITKHMANPFYLFFTYRTGSMDSSDNLTFLFCSTAGFVWMAC